MTQDTRKDKRAKIVSLNVRYKSATVDEFIENHSHDVSKGGIFIKTPTPFPPGTLIKFEIRIAGDKAVIAGVGRVVWKREAGSAAAERPAGMGVKFIKIDESSRQVIDRVVAEKSDAGSAFQSESEVSGANEVPKPPHEPRVTPSPVTVNEKPPRPQNKATMMGLGTVSAGTDLTATPVVGSPMFPKTNSEEEMPPKQERTVMKQAAALLEEALKEAGGSMDDIGSNPLFSGANDAAAHGAKDLGKSTLIGMPAAKDPISERVEAAKAQHTTPAPAALQREAGAAAAIAKAVPTAQPAAKSAPPESPREAVSAKVQAVEAEEVPTSRQRKTDPPAIRKRPASVPAPARAVVDDEPRARKKGGSGALIGLGLVVVIGGGIAFLYKDKLIESPSAAPASTPAATMSAPSAPPPPPTASASATAAATTEQTLDAAATASADAATTTKDAGAATTAATSTAAAIPATPPTTPPTPPKPPPPPPATAATPKPPAPSTAATESPAPKPPVTAAPPKPKPAPVDTSDNPY
jgi:uncharacterized protein (TIGR02266 family)